LLERLGVRFEVEPAGVEELEQGDPAVAAVENARRKARAVAARRPDRVVVGADTVVACEGVILGKPRDRDQAAAFLARLAGKRHTVHGGVAVVADGADRHLHVATEVLMRPLHRGLLDWYLDSGEWRCRAGGYAIQGLGSALVSEVHGDYENVVGLSLQALLALLPGLICNG